MRVGGGAWVGEALGSETGPQPFSGRCSGGYAGRPADASAPLGREGGATVLQRQRGSKAKGSQRRRREEWALCVGGREE